MEHWATRLVSELRAVDLQEAPHGLYGLRESRREGERLPKLPFVLVAPPIRFLRRIAGAQHFVKPSSDSLDFGIEGGRNIRIDFVIYADTKVRCFGDTYRLDKKAEQRDREPPNLKGELIKLGRHVDEDWGAHAHSFGLLFIGHVSKQRNVAELVGPICSDDFMHKYGLSHVGSAWSDAHRRDFWTTIDLWYVEQKTKA